MTKVVVPSSFESLLGQFSTKFDQAEAADVIHELKRLYPTKESFDQTDLYGALKQLYVLGAIDKHGDHKVLEILAEKTSKNKEIVNLLRSYKETSSQHKDEFVGRDDDVRRILKLVTDRRVPGVNLFGESGMGKTTLAKEVSKKLAMKHFETFIIDLRGTKDMKTVYFKVLEALKLTPWDYRKERIYTHLQVLTARTLLILDNVEQFLVGEDEVDEKRMTEYLEFLRTIMSSEASQRGSLKVILTSRIQIKDSMLEDIAFEEYELQPLTNKASRQLVSWRIKDETNVEQDKALVKIADLCRNTPYLLKRAEQLLRQNYSKPSEVLQKLNALKNKGVPERFACISALFDSLPRDHLKQVAVKISLLRRPFSVSTAMKIAEISSDYEAELELEILATHKIITAEDVNGERKYDLHALFREFVTYLCKIPVGYKDAYERAENQFVEHFSKKFVQLAKNLDKDFVGTYTELEEDKANLELSIDLITRKETLDLILQSDVVKEIIRVAMLFEQFMSVKERGKLFGEWAKIVEQKGSWLSSTCFRCLQSIYLADVGETLNACGALNRAEMSLKKAMLLLTPEQVKAAKGLCKYCSGQIKRMTSKNLIDESSKMEKERLLKQAILALDESLAIHEEVYGDHTLTARTLNLIGNCYMEWGKPNEALEFYQRALEMMKIKVVGSEKHFDIPTYYNQLSQVYEALGKQDTSPETSWSFQSIANRIWSLISQEKRKQFEKAVHFLEKALRLQEELGVNDTDDTATFQRNLANILIGLGKYDQALEYAKKSFKITKAHLGEHPETVRILYLTGIIHERRSDHKAALQSYEEAFVMEESLPDYNHSTNVARKRLCYRLEDMCGKLNKKDKLGEYKPRMDKIRQACFVRPTIMDEIPPYNRPDQTDDVYKMTSYPRGVAMIINIDHFTIAPDHPMHGKLSDRAGSKKDEEDFTHLFEHLGFIVETIDKTTARDLFAELRNISTNYDFSAYDCFVLCIMSHGAKNCIFASDGEPIELHFIELLFQKCKGLAGKPKLFFFQACRGNSKDQGVIPTDAQVDGDTTATTDSMQATPESNAIPKTADILEFYSSYLGFTSYRNTETGSPFIQSIVEVFRKHAYRHHVSELITKVKKRVSEDSFLGRKQMPQHKDTLSKFLYFWPFMNYSRDGGR